MKTLKSICYIGSLPSFRSSGENFRVSYPVDFEGSCGSVSDEEREKMTTLLNSGFTDSFRYLYPNKEGIYSWWSYRFNARKNNAGWRIDYFITSDSIKDKIIDSKIHTDIMGSDHCPVELDIDL